MRNQDLTKEKKEEKFTETDNEKKLARASKSSSYIEQDLKIESDFKKSDNYSSTNSYYES